MALHLLSEAKCKSARTKQKKPVASHLEANGTVDVQKLIFFVFGYQTEISVQNRNMFNFYHWHLNETCCIWTR